jgi:hypothetical protein
MAAAGEDGSNSRGEGCEMSACQFVGDSREQEEGQPPWCADSSCVHRRGEEGADFACRMQLVQLKQPQPSAEQHRHHALG